ncbi:MAG: DUF3253 domain-containing protein [Chloroflexi bacterium]|nr:DUF3253 domain-containing protein [Chloroflexota bacterium]
MKTTNEHRSTKGRKSAFSKPKSKSPSEPALPKHTNPPPKPRRRPRVSDDLIANTILEMCRVAGLEGSVRPEDIARSLVDQQWQTLLHRIRQTAAKQALAGDLIILRKGEAADPDDFKGLVKLQITAQGLSKSPPIKTAVVPEE